MGLARSCRLLIPAGLRSAVAESAQHAPLIAMSGMSCLPPSCPPHVPPQVAVLERPAGPSTLEFAPPETPEAAGPSIFPANMQLYFQPSEAEVAAAAETEEAAAAEAEAAVPATAPEGACLGRGVRERLLGKQHGCGLECSNVAVWAPMGSPRLVAQLFWSLCLEDEPLDNTLHPHHSMAAHGRSGSRRFTLPPLPHCPPACPNTSYLICIPLLPRPPAGNWERRSGEEVGAHGYWYRWTEVRGCDETGAVQVRSWWGEAVREAATGRRCKAFGAGAEVRAHATLLPLSCF